MSPNLVSINYLLKLVALVLVITLLLIVNAQSHALHLHQHHLQHQHERLKRDQTSAVRSNNNAAETLQSDATMMAEMGQMLMEKKEKIKGAGMQMGEKFSGMMMGGVGNLRGHMSKNVANVGQMVGSMVDGMHKSGATLGEQLKRGLSKSMGRMEGMQGMASGMGKQAVGVFETASQGAMAVSEQIHKTGDKLRSQLTQGLKQNMAQASQLFGSLTGSLAAIPQTMGKNMNSAMGGLSDIAGKAAMSFGESFASLKGGMMSGGGSGGYGGSSYGKQSAY